MVSCLLCLEINKDALDCIKANSLRWKELDMGKTIEKYFWSLNTIQSSSWLCLSCWRVVNDFHEFFLRIEEAHVNFGKIKLEDCTVSVECKAELTLQGSNIKENEGFNKDNVILCFGEPEILIDPTQQQDQIPNTDLEDDQESANKEPLVELDLENVWLNQANKRLRTQNHVTMKDPLEKAKHKKKKNLEAKVAAEVGIAKVCNAVDLKVKSELVGCNDNDNMDCVNDNDSFTADVNYKPNEDLSSTSENNRNQGCIRQRISSKENDKFISKHIEEMSCDLCQEQFRNFPALQKHFSKIHKQRGYVVCCERKFYDRTRLIDHLHRHLNPDHFKCKECGKAMSDRLTFVNHMLRVHRAHEVIRQHCCDICGKSFIKASVLRLHKLTHLSEEEKKYHCEDCGKKYAIYIIFIMRDYQYRHMNL